MIRPGLAWMLTRTHRYLATAMAQIRDPDGFARLHRLAQAANEGARLDARIAATRAATMLACKGGTIVEITVGDCVELVDTQRRVHVRGGQKKVDFYLRLHALGIFPDDAPHTIRAFGLAAGRLTIDELVDRYPMQCASIRNLIVDYLRERQPALDFASLDAVSRTLAGLFWSQIETIALGIDTLRLPAETARAWKECISVKRRTSTNAAGERVEVCSPRLNAKEELLRVRAFSLDIAQWATEDDPARWGPWAVPCPISDAEINPAKERAHRKSRMDQRTRERLPVLPAPVHVANQRRIEAAQRLQAARDTEPGALIPGTDATLRRRVAPKAIGHMIWAEHVTTGKAAHPVLRGGRSVLGVRHHRGPAHDRHPLRGVDQFTILIRDRAKRFTDAFDTVMTHVGITVRKIPPRSPRANAYAERFVLTARTEIADRMLIFGEQHLRRVFGEYARHYNGRRHTGRWHCSPHDPTIHPRPDTRTGQATAHPRRADFVRR